MRFTYGSAQHIGKRSQQQDSMAVVDNGAILLAVVADGMGGMMNGDAASQSAVKAFLQAFHAKEPTESVIDALFRSLHSANDVVFNVGVQMGAAEEMGTTLVAVAIEGETMSWVSAGDSGIFLVRNKELTLINQPHTFSVELDEMILAGAMSVEEAALNPEREALTSFLGMERLGRTDRNLKPFHLAEKDAVILASDGLFKSIFPEDILAALTDNARRSSESLVKRTIAEERPFQDNVSVIVLQEGASGDSQPMEQSSVDVQPAKPFVVSSAPKQPRESLSRILMFSLLIAAAALALYAYSRIIQ